MKTALSRRRGRRPVLFALSLALLTAGLVAGGAKPALADTCGAVQLSGSSWLSGSGVDVHSNYPDQGTGTSCGGWVTNLNASPPQYGYAWQCVELAQRLYNAMGWYSGVFSGVNVAADIYSQAQGGHLTNMGVQAQGSITSIVPGDMIIHGTSDTFSPGVGHVVIVNSVSGSTVNAVQQNANSATVTYTLASQSLSGGSGSDILGVVHSTKDTLTNDTAPPPTPYDPRVRSSAHLSADFTGDGKKDVAVLYDYGNNDTAVLVFRNTGSGFAAPAVWWDSGPQSWIWGNSKPLVGDFTGDGRPDIAIAYDYGNNDMGLLVLTNTGSSFNNPVSWFRSGIGGVNLWASKLMAADFDGDGRIDVGILYDYGNNDTAVLVLKNTGSAFNPPVSWWNSGVGNWAWGYSTPLVGDFNGDGRPDVMVMYDYGNSDMGLLLLPNMGTSFGTVQTWFRSGPGGVNAGAAWPIVGDFDGNGRPDVMMMYDYGNSTTAFLMFSNGGSSFSGPSSWWNSGAGNWAWGWSVPITADFSGDGKQDVVVMYNYGNNDTGLNLLTNTGTALAPLPTSWYRSGAGVLNWGASTAM